MTRDAMTVGEATQRWLEGRQARQELAGSTAASYSLHLASFVAFVGPDLPMADLDELHFEDWLAAQRRRDGSPLKPATLNTRASTVRAFAGWAARRRLAPFDISAGVGRARVPRGRPKRVQSDVIRQILAGAHQRERTIVLLGVHLGLRRGELCAIRTDHWDRHRDELTVMGKGSRERVLPVEGEVKTAMAEWVQTLSYGLPLRDLALVAVNDAGIGSWLAPRLRTEHWDPAAGVLEYPCRRGARQATFDGADLDLMRAYVRSLPSFGEQPGPLFPSTYHRRPGESIVKEVAARVVADTRAKLAAGVEISPWFFPSNHRPDLPLAARTMSKLVTDIGTTAADVTGLHPHALRHTMASELVEAGADLGVVRDLLGHASLHTTSIYVTASAPRMREAIAGRRYFTDQLGA